MKTIDWKDFDKFSKALDLYLPDFGEGDTRATQAVTAVNKLVYRWFNDGDTYDSSFENGELCNLANWLHMYCEDCDKILDRVKDISSNEQYSMLLYKLSDSVLGDLRLLKFMNKFDKVSSIYSCRGPFTSSEESFEEYY
jgi:hypothetical protein